MATDHTDYPERFEGWDAVGHIIGELMQTCSGRWDFRLWQNRDFTNQWRADIGDNHAAGDNPQQAVVRLLRYVRRVREAA